MQEHREDILIIKLWIKQKAKSPNRHKDEINKIYIFLLENTNETKDKIKKKLERINNRM